MTLPSNAWFVNFRIQIGAPRANSKYDHIAIEPGAVYRCDMMKSCFELKLRETKYLSKYRNHSIEHGFDNAWVGGAMDTDLINDRNAICGFRWSNRARFDQYYMMGTCFLTLDNNKPQALIPLNETSKATQTIRYGTKGQHKTSFYFYGQGQAGISVHFPQSYKKELLVGAPGYYNWMGIGILYRDLQYKISHDRTSGDSYLQGYSVSSGYFFKPDQLLYVNGAPGAFNGRGQIVVYNMHNGIMKGLTAREGTQMGEYFGAVVAVGDINGDNMDDLFVGSPLYATDFEEGRVTILFGIKGRNQKFVVDKVIDGEKSGGRFGTAIAILGDIDHDGFKGK